jgi:hypothetical protein
MLGVAGCPEKDTEPTDEPKTSSSGDDDDDDDDDKPAASASSDKPAPSPSASPSSGGGDVAIKPIAKDELDGKEADADHSGSSLGVKGTKAVFTVAKGWTMGTAELKTAVAGDEKGRFGATGYEAGGDTKAKTEEAVKELELTDCKWGSEEDITLGKGKLPAKVTDGVCMRDKTAVRTIRAVLAEDDANVVAVGGWDDGSDNKAILNTFRSLRKVDVQACCSAIKGNMASAPANQKLIYGAAYALCQSLVGNPDAMKALAQLRGKLGGVTIPAACR